MARGDRRVVACAIIGSSAGGSGVRWSDVDLTFGLDDDVSVTDVLNEWTRRLEGEFNAVYLFDLPRQPTTYRVFLLPGNLQVDLSFTPRAQFGALGPKFELLFREAVKRGQPTPISPQHLFGLAVHHLVRARICIERGRMWQAEYWLSAGRDHSLTIACYHRGLATSYGRGFDDLPPEILQTFTGTLVVSLDRGVLLQALGRIVDGLLGNSRDTREVASRLETQLRELASPTIE